MTKDSFESNHLSTESEKAKMFDFKNRKKSMR